jgi:hypothetical protein
MALWLPIGLAAVFIPLAAWVYIDARRPGRAAPSLAPAPAPATATAPTATPVAAAYALATLVIGPLGFVAYLAARSAAMPDSTPAVRYPAIGAIDLGLLGAVVGLIVGLIAYPPTALFAALELGIPAAVLGGLAGLIIGAARTLSRTLQGRGRDPGRRSHRRADR